MAVGLLQRLGFPSGQVAKIVDGHHPDQLHTSSATPKADMLPIDGEDGQGATCRRNVVVAISGNELDTELVTLACNVAKQKKAAIYAVYGIEVPRKLAIDAEMPDETNAAGEAIERAAQVADQMHMRLVPEIVQSRHFGQSLVDETKAHECALLIVGLPYHIGLGGHFDLGETAEYALKNANCRVWLVRGQRPEGAAPTAKAERPDTVGAAR